MTYTINDVSGLLAAVAVLAALLLLPGIALGHLTNAFAFRHQRTAWLYALGLIVGYAVLPAADGLVARFLGLGVALAFNLVLAAYGLCVVWMRGLPRPDRLARIACVVWLLLLIVFWVDFDFGGRLYPSLLAVDTVKHAATVRALVESGVAPPLDPFFLRDDAAGSYYYYYVRSALAERVGAGWIDSRAAVGGQVFWTGIALIGLVSLVFREAGFRRHGTRLLGPNLPLLLALMAAAGLQILLIVLFGFGLKAWLGQVNAISQVLSSWPMSVLWVPHHIAALVACWAGFLLLANAVEPAPASGLHDGWSVVLAAAAFASAAGLSIWVTTGAVVTVGAWTAVLAWERRWSVVLKIVAAGALSAALALPYLVDVLHNRAYGSAPIEFAVLSSPFIDGAFEPGLGRQLARLVALPLVYFIEF